MPHTLRKTPIFHALNRTVGGIGGHPMFSEDLSTGVVVAGTAHLRPELVCRAPAMSVMPSRKL
jgi:hypothetical protein